MSELSGKYKQIIEELESNINEQETLKFVKEKFADLSMLFIDIIDRVTELTDVRMKTIEEKQKDIASRILAVQTAVDGIESDIYEDDDNYEFEIVCPYCNYEFTTALEEEDKEEVQCPECHNIIELDWNPEAEANCSSNCSHCSAGCNIAEESEEYNLNLEEDENREDEDM